jgi:isocitrate dehydrogenase kinase/phosphatase
MTRPNPGRPEPAAKWQGDAGAESVRARQLTRAASTTILDAFDHYVSAFNSVSRRARTHFEQREWDRWQADAVARLALREQVISDVVAGLHAMLGDQVHSTSLWIAIKHSFASLIARHASLELAETFFNSVTRRVMGTVGVNQNMEFVWFGATMLPGRDNSDILRRYTHFSDTPEVIQRILQDCTFEAPYADLAADASLVADALERELERVWESADFEVIEVLKAVFYRNKGAYLIGRITKRNRVLPLILPLLHDERGVYVDAALFSEEEASKVFSFTRAYFHVDAGNPTELVGFLKSILPQKPIAELYTSLGWNKHGKTMLYRALYRHLGNSSDRFEVARGVKGMVMTVFTLPSYDIVFKIIRDRFGEAKSVTRADVVDRYSFVFRHDRVGRMVDAQEFENLTFERDRFTNELLDELAESAANTVTITDNQVVVKHVYTERRLYPLDLYVKEMGPEHAQAAIRDYACAIADLAAANIFPGDLFIKNFGVTRHDRVVFYDYDEVCLLTECNFRHLPQSASYDDEMSAQPWFSVSANDVFPEEFRTFLWLPGPLRNVLEKEHAHLFSVEWWQERQARVRAGEIMDIFPYGQETRLRR